MADQWHYTQAGQQRGPVSLQQLQDMARNGALPPTEMVWRQGMANWQQAGSVAELFSAGAAPAPAPIAAPAAQRQVISYQQPGSGDMLVTQRALEMLRQTKPWARFLAILGFVAIGLMAFGGIIVMIVGAAVPHVGGSVAALGLVYVAMAGLYIAPTVFLNRYATAIGATLAGRRTNDLESALEAQKSFWKYVGILTLVILCLYAVILLVALVVGIAA